MSYFRSFPAKIDNKLFFLKVLLKLIFASLFRFVNKTKIFGFGIFRLVRTQIFFEKLTYPAFLTSIYAYARFLENFAYVLNGVIWKTRVASYELRVTSYELKA